MYTIKKGEKYPIKIKLRNLDEDKPINLTNSIIKFQLKDEPRDDFFIIEKNITETSDIYEIGRIISPEDGEVILHFTNEDYDKLVCERMYYITIWHIIEDENYAKVVSSNGNEHLTLMVCIP